MPSRELGFIPRLEALRGLAAAWVAGLHVYSNYNDTVVTGMAPVVVFFVLSGFVLARALERNSDPLTFVRHRAFRLFPAAIVTVLALTALHSMFGFYVGFEASFDWLNVAANALLIRSDINGPMWSLTVEAFATPLILVSFWACRRFGPALLYAGCAILFGLSFWGAYVHLLGGWTNIAPLYCFVAGVLVHFAAARASQPRFVAVSGLFVTAVLIAVGTRKQTAPILLVECVASAWLIYLIAVSRNSKIFAVSRLPPVRFLGKVSYSFYLLDLPAIAIAARLVPPDTLAVFATTVILLLPISWLSWRWVEVPFVRIARSKNANDVATDDRRLDVVMRPAAAGIVDGNSGGAGSRSS